MDKVDRARDESELNNKLTTENIIAKALHYQKTYDDCTVAIKQLKASITQNGEQTIETQDSTEEIKKLKDKQDEVYDFYYGIVHIIETRGSETEFKYSKSLANSLDANERMLAADVLGELGYYDSELGYQGNDKYYEYAVLKLIELMDDEYEEVIDSAAISLGKRIKGNDFRAIKRLVELADHYSRNIRYAVVYALGGSEHKEAIETLIRLSDDEDFEVKNWAVFGLGTLIDADTPDIRQALKNQLDDEDFIIRGEAMVGLAKRDDKSILDAVKKELGGEIEDTFAIDASEMLADPSLLKPLLCLKNLCKEDRYSCYLEGVEDAITACSK